MRWASRSSTASSTEPSPSTSSSSATTTAATTCTTAAGGTATWYAWRRICCVSCPSTTAPSTRRSPPRITPRGRSCSGTAGNITSCGRKGAGRAPITASPTPSPTRPSGRSNASARSSNKTRRSPAAPGTTPSYRFRGGTNGTSSTTAARWTKRQPAAVKPASTACISMPRGTSSRSG